MLISQQIAAFSLEVKYLLSYSMAEGGYVNIWKGHVAGIADVHNVDTGELFCTKEQKQVGMLRYMELSLHKICMCIIMSYIL